MTEEQPFAVWIRSQPPGVQLGFMLPLFLLKDWYCRIQESPDRAFSLLAHYVGIGGAEITMGVRSYLHLIHGDNVEFPEDARAFLAQSPELVIPILRAFLRKHLDTEFAIPDAGFGADDVDNVVTLRTMAVLFPEDAVRKADAAIATLKERIRFTVISEATEAHARALLDTGGVTERHPAHAFLTYVVELAPRTRELPARAAALAALLPTPQE